MGKAWPVSVAPALGGSFRPSASAPGSVPLPGHAVVITLPVGPQMRMPRFELAAMGGITDVRETPAPAAPPACDRWMTVPVAQAAERLIDFAYADAMAASIPPRGPDIGKLRDKRTFVRSISMLAQPQQAEPVAISVAPVLDSRPAAVRRGPALLRFGLHTVDDVGSRAGAAIQAPEPAGLRPGLQPAPVESMPSVAAFAAVALSPALPVSFPAIRCITAQVLPQAQAVSGPAAMPVERMPASGRPAISALDMRPALRLPTVARFQPVEDASEGLAAPVSAPGPTAVESRPRQKSLAVVPRPAAPALLVQDFHAELRAEFPMPVVAAPAARIAAPGAARPQPAMLDPMSRIQTPAASQPERPAPAIPHPGIFPLEYYCQRITSAPIKDPQPLTTSIGITPPPFAIAAALGRFEELLYQKPSRKVLPFEEIFAKRPAEGNKRLHLSATGKIAAAVMVGLALWTGSKIANLSQHTEALRAQVASSERAVTVAEAHGSDPTLGNFGNGPVGKLKRAIANRAATEITDTFKTGMSAWGAEAKSLAPGWQRHPQGYVSTGTMALFQPSITYTDYHMEFYGQIEDKSMGWVVRAQDKKNYYAMKFTVIEPGLRPIIAMVHYGVTDGKQGHKVQTPLSVMVHNNQPYHVAVDVRGNHFTTSIEGEPVESWTDDTLAQGGVGFFSDAGEKARLYWMKLSRNQDWLGRFCAYLSGDGTSSRQQTAELWGPEIPRDKPEPVHPWTPDRALALGGAGLDEMNSPNRARSGKYRRNEAWIS